MGISSLAVSQGNYENQINVVERESALLVTVFDAVNARAVAARNMVLLDAAPDETAIEKRSVELSFERINASMKELKSSLVKADAQSAVLQRKVEEIEKIEAKYAVVATQIVTECRPLLRTLVAAKQEIDAIGAHDVAASIAQNRQLRLQMFAAIAVALLVAGALAAVMTKKITGPIAQAVVIAETVANGDLSTHIDTSSRDETGQLFRALHSMQGSLSKVVNNVRNGSESVSIASAKRTSWP